MLYITASSSSKHVETAVEGPGERKLKGPAERRAGRLLRADPLVHVWWEREFHGKCLVGNRRKSPWEELKDLKSEKKERERGSRRGKDFLPHIFQHSHPEENIVTAPHHQTINTLEIQHFIICSSHKHRTFLSQEKHKDTTSNDEIVYKPVYTLYLWDLFRKLGKNETLRLM